MFKELKLTENFTILTSTITNIDNSMLVKDFEYNCDISKYTTDDSTPGKQSRIHIISKNITDSIQLMLDNNKHIDYMTILQIP